MPADPALGSALARLESRWGSAAVRVGLVAGRPDVSSRPAPVTDAPPVTNGALALAPVEADPSPGESGSRETAAPSLADEIVPTGFARLDALLGPGGLPRGASAAFRGARSSGKTALALHCLAQAQARGGIVAFLDLGRIFDPVEAAARGVDLRWLLVIRPANAEEGWALAAALVSGRQVDLLVIDLPERLASAGNDASLRRLAAHARRSSVRLIVLEPIGLAASVHGALAESVALRLELEQRAWLRAGRDIVGRSVMVNVAKNRFGPPGRQTEIEIRYLADGEHAAALDRFATAAEEVARRFRPALMPSSADLSMLRLASDGQASYKNPLIRRGG